MGRHSDSESDHRTAFEVLSATHEMEYVDGQQGLYVTALGTGASALTNGRASAGYVIHVDGDSRFLLDAGGGTAARLTDANIDLTAIDAIFLGHLHIDHTADVPAIVKAAYQQGRETPFTMYGPTGTRHRPGTEAWVSKLFDEHDGAYNYLAEFVDRYLNSELDLTAHEIDATIQENNTVQQVYEADLTVEAIPETHGRIPALAYRFTSDECSITFSGDTTLETDNLRQLADGTDVLIHNRMLDSHIGTDDPSTELHSVPREIGETAQQADVGVLVLSHISQDSRDEIEQKLEHIRAGYDGPIVVVCDLALISADGWIGSMSPDENETLIVRSMSETEH